MTPNLDGLEQKIDQGKMKSGNQVLASTGLIGTASNPLSTDSNSNLQVTAPVPITPSAATTTFLNLTGRATSDVMTSNFVVDGAGGATTFTKKGYIKISVTDSGAVGTNGDYYIQIGTLT